MIRRLKLTLFALFCLLVAGQFLWIDAEAQDIPAEKFFKNIKALKGLSAGQVSALMVSYNEALGVDCFYCHVEGNPADESKPAHKMTMRDIAMTREINEKYGHAKLDCMTCHQGKAKPTPGFIAKGGAGPTTPIDKPQTIEQPASSGMGPDNLSFRAVALGATKVAFPHAKHIEIVSSDCSRCHHTGDTGKCDGCHKHNSGNAGLSFQVVSHSTKVRGCAGCHIQSKAGPTKCAECHKK
jgi:hypothetical protein